LNFLYYGRFRPLKMWKNNPDIFIVDYPLLFDYL
jgi:hypothetical protein